MLAVEIKSKYVRDRKRVFQEILDGLEKLPWATIWLERSEGNEKKERELYLSLIQKGNHHILASPSHCLHAVMVPK